MTQKPQISEEIMSIKPREWPYKAKEARDRSAEEAVVISRLLAEIIEATNDAVVLKLAARASKSATTIMRFMESEGAQTRPE
jgi:hypothetical protein